MKCMQQAASVAAVVLFATLATPASAGSDDSQTFTVLKRSDFIELTGCDPQLYRTRMLSALGFLVFLEPEVGNPNNARIQYARRHTRPLFGDLRSAYKTADGALEERCLPPSLRGIALALRLLDADGRYTGETAPVAHAYDAQVIGSDKPAVQAFPVMSRQAYMAQTKCLISPSSYGKYRVAFEAVVLWAEFEERARENMTGFLEDLYDNQPTPEGFVKQRCMVPAISRIAAELDLLESDGRYRAQH